MSPSRSSTASSDPFLSRRSLHIPATDSGGSSTTRLSVEQTNFLLEMASLGIPYETMASVGTPTTTDRVCLCGNIDCAGLSSAFRILGQEDERSSFHKIPYRKKKDSKSRASVDAIRRAYVAALFPKASQRPKLQGRQDYYIAKHHFHPTLVAKFSKLPYTLAPSILEKHNIDTGGLRTLGSVLSEPHPNQDSYIIVPNYPKANARKDLQNLLEGRDASRPSLFHLQDSWKHRPASKYGVSAPNDMDAIDLTESTRSLSERSWDDDFSGRRPSAHAAMTDLHALPRAPITSRSQSTREKYHHNDDEEVNEDTEIMEANPDQSDKMTAARKGREWKKRISRSLSRAGLPRDRDRPKSGLLKSIASELQRRRSRSPFKRSTVVIPRDDPNDSTEENMFRAFDSTPSFPVVASTQPTSSDDEENSLEGGVPLLSTPGHSEKVQGHGSLSESSFSTWVTEGEDAESSDSPSESQRGLKAILPSFGRISRTKSNNLPLSPSLHRHDTPPLDTEEDGDYSETSSRTSRRSTARDSTRRTRRSLSPRRVLRSLSIRPAKRSESPRRTIRSSSVQGSTRPQSGRSIRTLFDSSASYTDVNEETMDNTRRGRDRSRGRNISRSLSKVVRLRKKVEPQVPPPEDDTVTAIPDNTWVCSFDTGVSYFDKSKQSVESRSTSNTKRGRSTKKRQTESEPSWNAGSQEKTEEVTRQAPFGLESLFADRPSAAKELTEHDIAAFFGDSTAGQSPKAPNDGFHFSEWNVPSPNEMDAKFTRSRSLSRSRPTETESLQAKARARSSSRTVRAKSDRNEKELFPTEKVHSFTDNEFKTAISDVHSVQPTRDTQADSNVGTIAVAEDTDASTSCSSSSSSDVHADVLETSQLQTLLGGDDEDSDFEEVWEKSKGSSTLPQRQVSRLLSENEKSPKKKTDVARHQKSSSRTSKYHSKGIDKEVPQKKVTEHHDTGNDKEVAESESSADKGDLRIGSIVEGLWEGVSADSSGVDDLAGLLDDVDVISIEICRSESLKEEESPKAKVRPKADISSPNKPKKTKKGKRPQSLDDTTDGTEDSTLDRSQSTQDASNSAAGDSLNAEDASNTMSALSSPEEEEEAAYLEMLKVEEVERHDWFVHMQCVLESDFRAHRQVLATMVSELEQVEHLMKYSYQAIDVYAQAIKELCSDPAFSELSTDNGNDIMMGALVKAYQAIAKRFEEGLPALKVSVEDIASYKVELTSSINEIEGQGLGMLSELNASEEAVRRSWDTLQGASADDKAKLARDYWLEEVDYRQAVTRHLSLWKQRGSDLKGITSRILDMEFECHESLKTYLLDFLPKRHRLFVGIRDLLDPAVDALETYNLLTEMESVDRRLEDAVVQFQPGKKRSILSLVSSNSTPTENEVTVPGLDNFESMTVVKANEKLLTEDVLDCRMISVKLTDEWNSRLVVVSRQHCLHVYAIPDGMQVLVDEALQENAVQSVLLSSSPLTSITLSSCDTEQIDNIIKISSRRNGVDGANELDFPSSEDASAWLSGIEHLLESTSSSPEVSEGEGEESEKENAEHEAGVVVRV